MIYISDKTYQYMSIFTKTPFEFNLELKNRYMIRTNIETNLFGHYHSSEQLYQSLRCRDSEVLKKILSSPNAYAVRQIAKYNWRGSGNGYFDDKNKIKYMHDANLIKFSSPDLKNLLLLTKDEDIVNDLKYPDLFWGVHNGVGQNNLGKILMDIREFFIKGIPRNISNNLCVI